MARGFTLVELIVGMLLISILAAALWPRAPSQDSITIQGRAEQLASDIRYAQTLSMTTGKRHCLALTPGPTYSAYSLTAADPLVDPSGPCVIAADHPAGLTQPVTLCASGTCVAAPALANNYVQFDGVGRPYTSPTTPLAANAVITIADDGTRTVTISPETGRVVVQ